MLTKLLLALCISAAGASACTDVELSVKQAKRHSEMVFRGKVTAQTFAGDGSQTVIFSVSRVWKGHLRETLEIPVNPMNGCVNPFRSTVVIGSEFLIFAWKAFNGYEYAVLAVSTTYGSQLLQQLGPGRKPK